MTLHYNIYPSNSPICGGIVRFYLSDCDARLIIVAVDKVNEILDSSIGKCDYLDWDFKSNHGTFRINTTRGIDTEAIMGIMNDLRDKVFEWLENY